jgi:hypothetical protein
MKKSREAGLIVLALVMGAGFARWMTRSEQIESVVREGTERMASADDDATTSSAATRSLPYVELEREQEPTLADRRFAVVRWSSARDLEPAGALLESARQCLKDPFFNPDAAELSQADLDALQRLIDDLNREFARTIQQRDDAIQALIKHKFEVGDYAESGQELPIEKTATVLCRAEIFSTSDAVGRTRRTVVVAGESKEIDDLTTLLDDMTLDGRQIVRCAIEDLVHPDHERGGDQVSLAQYRPRK